MHRSSNLTNQACQESKVDSFIQVRPEAYILDDAVMIDILPFPALFQKSIRLLKRMAAPNRDLFDQLLGNRPLSAEQADYTQYVNYLSQLQVLVLAAYQQAEQNNEQITLDYLQQFADKLDAILPTLMDQKINLFRKQNLIAELITVSKPSPDLMAYLEPVVSPIFGLIGGVLGLLLGLPVGAVCGVGLCLLAMLKSGTVMMDGNALLVVFGCAAVIGAGYGAFEGATKGATYLWGLSHSNFFKPCLIQDLLKHLFYSASFKRHLGRQILQDEAYKAISATGRDVIPDLIAIIGDYMDAEDKEKAVVAIQSNRRSIRV
jgi:hypothetical protein